MKVICSFITRFLSLYIQSEHQLCVVPGAEDVQRTDETESKHPGVRFRVGERDKSTQKYLSGATGCGAQ